MNEFVHLSGPLPQITKLPQDGPHDTMMMDAAEKVQEGMVTKEDAWAAHAHDEIHGGTETDDQGALDDEDYYIVSGPDLCKL